MKYPNLIRESDCKTVITIVVNSKELGEDGEQISYGTVKTKCNYQGSSKRIMSDDRQAIDLMGICLISGDIFPELPEISSGEVIIFGETRTINKGRKARNPDGSVNYVELELI